MGMCWGLLGGICGPGELPIDPSNDAQRIWPNGRIARFSGRFQKCVNALSVVEILGRIENCDFEVSMVTALPLLILNGIGGKSMEIVPLRSATKG
jgi:hypothetical protein